MGFPGGSAGKESACNAGDLGSIPGLGRHPGKGKGYPLQYSGLEKSMDCIVQGVAKSWTPLSNFHFPFPTLPVNYCYSANPDSNWYRQPREATQMTDTHTEVYLAKKLEKEMATTPVFLPGKFHGQRSLAGYDPWGHIESDAT